MSERRILSLWFPYFSIDRLSHGEPGPDAEPVVTLIEDHGRQVVAGVNHVAEMQGIFPGQAYADARALEPGLRVGEADRAGDRRVLDGFADWCGRYTPLVALDPTASVLGGGEGPATGDAALWLDISGCAHLFGGEDGLLADLSRRLQQLGFTARAAIADTPGAAWAVARFGDGGIVAPGNQTDALAEFPIAALRLPAAAVEGLARSGLRKIGALYPVARAPLAARFGPVVGLRLDQALGRMQEPVSPRLTVAPHRVRMNFPEPIALTGDIEHAASKLLHRLAERLERDHLGARRLRLWFHRVDGEARPLTIGCGRPRRDARALLRLFAEHFDKLDPGFGIDLIVLEALVVEPLAWEQGAVTQSRRAGNVQAVADLSDRITNRLGDQSVQVLAPVESHMPERAERRQARQVSWADVKLPTAMARPARLMRRPEPVEAMALLPDHPPVRFQWRGRSYRVVRAAGPERISPEWWHEEGGVLSRDYFRVEDEEGRRYWLYREGLAERGEIPEWRLHGLFG